MFLTFCAKVGDVSRAEAEKKGLRTTLRYTCAADTELRACKHAALRTGATVPECHRTGVSFTSYTSRKKSLTVSSFRPSCSSRKVTCAAVTNADTCARRHAVL